MLAAGFPAGGDLQSAGRDLQSPSYYVFNAADSQGFVVVSGDERTVPVLGYTDSGSFDEDTMPDGLRWLLQCYTEQMAQLADRNIHYAFFVCDGRFNMNVEEASACARLVNAQHSIPYHMVPGKLFDQKRAELFDVPNRLILPAGEEIILE